MVDNPELPMADMGPLNPPPARTPPHIGAILMTNDNPAALDDGQLAALVRAGRKVACPVCERRCMSQSYAPFSSSGIGQHIRAAHPELEAQVYAATSRSEAARKADADAANREARERPLREHVLTGAEIDEIVQELGSLIGMMEPYWSQGNGADSALELIDRLEALATRKEGSGQ